MAHIYRLYTRSSKIKEQIKLGWLKMFKLLTRLSWRQSIQDSDDPHNRQAQEKNKRQLVVQNFKLQPLTNIQSYVEPVNW